MWSAGRRGELVPFGQPASDLGGGQLVASGLSFGDGAAEMQAADGGGGEVFGAERVDHLARVGREGGLVAGELDEQGRDRDPGGAAEKVRVRAEPGPGRQPRFGGGEPVRP